MEASGTKKIQFSVPLLQEQLDPQAAEHIRRRRPTPATLIIYQQLSGTDVGENAGVREGTESSRAPQRRQSTFASPTMTDLQVGVEQRMQIKASQSESDSLGSPITPQRHGNSDLWANQNGPEETNGNDDSLVLDNELAVVSESCSLGDLSSDHESASSPISVSR